MSRETPEGEFPRNDYSELASELNRQRYEVVTLRERGRQRLAEILSKQISEFGGPVDVLSSRERAMRHFQSDVAERRLAGIFALTFYWRDDTDAFRSAVKEILRHRHSDEILRIAVNAAANLYAGTSNDEVLRLLRDLEPLTSVDPRLRVGVLDASESVLRDTTLPDRDIVQGALERHSINGEWTERIRAWLDSYRQ
ncbi:MAG: hypothetical protein KDA55_23070 [Planctomycetales bacterium]|nr:hypothetical protein [Planctomycetales bacterium]